MVGAWGLVLGAAAGLVVVSWFINPALLLSVAGGVGGRLFLFIDEAVHGFLAFFSRVGAWPWRRSARGWRCGDGLTWPPVVLAVAVVFWLVGFDIIYATQDYESDKVAGTALVAGAVGIAGSLRFARCGARDDGGAAVGIRVDFADCAGHIISGWSVIVVCLVVQHLLARKQDPVSLNAAFFRMNAIISVVLLAAVAVVMAVMIVRSDGRR